MGLQGILRLSLYSLTSNLKYAVIAFLFWVAVTAYPFQIAMAGHGCGTLKKMLSESLSSGFAFLSTAISSKGLALVFLVEQSGNWMILGVDDTESSCIVAQGTNWVFAMESDI